MTRSEKQVMQHLTGSDLESLKDAYRRGATYRSKAGVAVGRHGQELILRKLGELR